MTTISNAEAIKGLKVLAKDFSGYKPNEEMFNLAISALEKQEQDRWVSVTERLPEYGTEVLTQLSDNEIVVNWVIDEEDEEWFEYGVVAWRPLPELYEGL